MLNFAFIIANLLVTWATYQYVTHSVPAAIVGFIAGSAVWFLVFND